MRQIVANMRIPGGKPIWILVDDLNSAKRIVEWIDLYVAAFKALPADHPDVPGLLEKFRNGEFKQLVLQALESEIDYLQQEAGAIQSTAAEVPEGTIRAMLFFLFGVQRKPEVHIRLSVDMLEALADLGIFFVRVNNMGFMLTPEICIQHRFDRRRQTERDESRSFHSHFGRLNSFLQNRSADSTVTMGRRRNRCCQQTHRNPALIALPVAVEAQNLCRFLEILLGKCRQELILDIYVFTFART